MAKWTRIEDGLPKKTGWYLTYSPGYWHSGINTRGNCDGLVFSKFTVARNGKSWWSIEGPLAGQMNDKCVLAWMPLPLPEWATKKEDK